MRRQRLAALVIATLAAGGPAFARTLETEPNDTAQEATALDAERTLIGSFEAGRDLDFATVVVEGLRLWRFQVAGEGVTSLTLFDPGGNKVVSVNSSGKLTRLSNLLLPPGRYTVQIKGREGRYLFRVIDQGPAPDEVSGDTAAADPGPRDPDAGPKVNEIEPNNVPGDAMDLAFGARRTGLFDSAADADLYRFSLTGATRVRLTFETIDQELIADLTEFWGATPGPRIRITPPPSERHPDPLVWEGLLPGGDFLLRLRARRMPDRPYALTLERRPFYEVPIDREPNNEGGQESPFPPDGVLRGVLSGDGDIYRLPVRAEETVYRLTAPGAEAAVRKLRLRMAMEVDPPAPDEWRKRKWKNLRQIARDGPSGWVLTVPANTEASLAVTGPIGPYHIAFAGFELRAPAPAVTAALSLNADRIAAFARRTQRLEGTLAIANDSGSALKLRLDAHVENALWRVELGEGAVDLPAGGKVGVPVTVLIAPDAWDIRPVHVSAAVFVDDRPDAVASAAAEIMPDPDAAPVNAGPVWTLPDAMLGGLNVAWSALGATVPRKREALIDGLAVPQRSLRLAHRQLARRDLIVDLAGDAPVALAGVILSLPQGAMKPDDLLYRFRVEASLDGESFAQVLTGELALHAEPQAFAFAGPVEARFVRLVPLTTHAPSGKSSHVALGEFQAIAVPGTPLEGEPPINIADPLLGGHVVLAEPVRVMDAVLEAGSGTTLFIRPHGGWKTPPRMVIGFRDGRAAQIAGLVFEEGRKPGSNFAEVIVETSMDGPLGPWSALGEPWDVTPGAGRSELTFDTQPWVRYLRLTFPPLKAGAHILLPDVLRVLEREPGPDYRSIAGEWTAQGPEAVHEWLGLAGETSPPAGPDAGDTMATAAALVPGTPSAGTVWLGQDEDWFRLEVGEPGGNLAVTLSARPTIDAVFEITDGTGGPLDVPTRRISADRLAVETFLMPGTYHIRVLEPPRSMVVSWDTSGSVSGFINQIRRGVRAFSRDLVPGRDEANFLPFAQNPKFLLDDWTGDRATAAAALYGYDRRNLSSSNAELAMLRASSELATRDGVHAILVVTDLQSNGEALNAELWRSFAKSRAKVFAIGVPTAAKINTPRRIHEMFRDWTMPGGGYLDYLTSESRTSVAFRRAAAWLRRPAAYTLEAGLVLAPPEPATLEVTAAPESAVTARAVEVILDGSGSMLKRLGGVRRYRVARDALLTLTGEVLPVGTPFALRIFGKGGRGSCRTDLELPLAPLDRRAARKAVQGFKPVNLAKTPIGASLAAIAGDLEGASVSSIVVLLTDGEETCDGDPAAEIARLRELGFDVQVNIVGFALDDAALKANFAAWAEAGGGGYFNAGDADELNAALRAAIAVPFEVRRDDRLVARGVVNGAALELPPGSYDVVIGSAERARSRAVNLPSGAAVTIVLE